MADNRDMSAYWDRTGRVWVEQQELLDRLFAPIAEAVVDRADLRNGEHVLDVGCGAGATTFAAAWRVGPSGRAVGVDGCAAAPSHSCLRISPSFT